MGESQSPEIAESKWNFPDTGRMRQKADGLYVRDVWGKFLFSNESEQFRLSRNDARTSNRRMGTVQTHKYAGEMEDQRISGDIGLRHQLR
jgi:predicted acetyltransferase